MYSSICGFTMSTYRPPICAMLPGRVILARPHTGSLDGREAAMRTRALLPIAALLLVVGLATATQASPGEARVTRDATAGSYTLGGGGTDATMTACSTGRRSQNEPTVAVDPRNPAVVVAGSNDYCAQIVNGDVWAGCSRPTGGGQTWADSLVPGYPADGSPAGMASPAHGVCGAAGDPTQAFDTGGRLFYGFICFNRAKPVNGGIYVATYGSDGATYLRTVEVAKGSPSAQFNGSGAFRGQGKGRG